ncbi:MAG: M14 family metallopeptidase [Candidatus Aminicenantes bacterium]|jgi:murein tripeptide amidase MpaA
MRNLSKITSAVLLLFSFFLLPASIPADDSPSTGYHNYQALTNALKQVAGQNSKITKLTSIGKTLKGRDLWMLRVSGVKGPSPLEKQALLICGNLEGDHVIGSEVALGIAKYLVDQYGKDDQVTKVLNTRTFYIIPRLNPDGAELFFNPTLQEYSGNLKPRDEDYDWLVDEDSPEDLNGDGMITMMRVKDKEGDWFIDDKDPRLMKKKKADTPLDKLYKVYPEGIDNDGDELYNEDGQGGFNINRNFPHNFGYKPKGFGIHPASELETQAFIDFMTRYVPEQKTQPHKNICGVLLFSKFDNLAAGTGIECGTPTFPQPSGVGRPSAAMGMVFFMGRRRGAPAEPQLPPPTDPQPKRTNSRDASLFTNVSKQYKEITGIKSAESEKPAGSLLEWAYFQFGVPAFSANLWSLRQEEQRRPPTKKQSGAQPEAAQPTTRDRAAMFRQFQMGARSSAPAQTTSNDEKWLKWIDEKNGGKGFVKWTKFNHKQLGEVEIGGFQPYLRVNPPADQIPALSKSHAEFALYLASQFAEITMDAPEVKKLSSNLFELKIKIHNKGKFPYQTAMGQRTRNINSIMLRLKFEDDKSMKLFGGNKRNDTSSLAVGAEKEFKWVIISPPGKKIDVTLWALNGGGTTKKTVVLK